VWNFSLFSQHTDRPIPSLEHFTLGGKKTEREKGGERKFFYFFSRQERASSFQDGQFLSNME
jgi:hypothetical protein